MPTRPIVTQALLVVMAVVFGMQQLWPEWMLAWFGLWPDVGPILLARTPDGPVFARFELWQFLSHGFLHGGLAHLVLNGLALMMFGGALEQVWGGRRFVIFFLLCVIGGGLAQWWWTGVPEGQGVSVTLGASGGVFGVLLAFGMMYPHQRIMLIFPPIPMPAWLFVTLYGLAELWFGVTGTRSGVAHFAHLGGMLAGFVLIQYWRGRLPFKPRRILTR